EDTLPCTNNTGGPSPRPVSSTFWVSRAVGTRRAAMPAISAVTARSSRRRAAPHPRAPAPVEHQRAAVDERGRVRAEVGHRGGHLGRLDQPLDRRLRPHYLLAQLFPRDAARGGLVCALALA